MNRTIERRVRELEKKAGHRAMKTFCLIEHADGSITGADPTEIRPGDMVVRVCSSPWDSTEQRVLSDDEMEAKSPGRRERLALWNEVLMRGPVIAEFSPEDMKL